jgi:hypothetical protein
MELVPAYGLTALCIARLCPLPLPASEVAWWKNSQPLTLYIDRKAVVESALRICIEYQSTGAREQMKSNKRFERTPVSNAPLLSVGSGAAQEQRWA